MKINLNNGEFLLNNCNCSFQADASNTFKKLILIPDNYNNDHDLNLIKSWLELSSPILINSIKMTQGEEAEIFFEDNKFAGILNQISYLILKDKLPHWEIQIEY